MAGERWWGVEVVRVRKRMEGVEELVMRRRVSMMYELASYKCDSSSSKAVFERLGPRCE